VDRYKLNLYIGLLHLALFAVVVGLVDVLVAIVFVLPLASIVGPSIVIAVFMLVAYWFMGIFSGDFYIFR